MKDRVIIALIIFSAVMYGVATAASSVFEEFTGIIYFMGGIIYAAAGYAYVNCEEGEKDEW